jgi:hypothetical protein
VWKHLYDPVRQVLTLTKGTQRNRPEMLEVRQVMKDLTAAVHWPAYEIRRVSEQEASEREKMALKLGNQLLRFGRQLPPARRSQREKGTNCSWAVSACPLLPSRL